jgi:peptidoglycan/LPS O-acetylase OafA/YrhL
MATTTKPPRRRADIEGLRGVAVLAVVGYHVGLPGMRGGYVGVDVFFVISGFLITSLIWREIETCGSLSFRSFYARRARRLLPASFIVVITTIVAARLVMPPLRAATVARDGIAASAYVANVRFGAAHTGYLESVASPSPLQHFWSLGVEEQFYLVWPALLLVLAVGGRRRRGSPSRGAAIAGLAALGALSLAACVWMTRRAPTTAFYSLPTRTWEFVVGGSLGLSWPLVQRVAPRVRAVGGWLGAVVIVAAVIHYDAATQFPGVAAAAPVGAAGFILAAGPRGGVARVLSSRILTTLGRVSYTWYLWHWPFLVIGAVVAGRPMSTWARLALALVALLVAALTTRLIEQPIRTAASLVRAPRLVLTSAAVVTLLALGFGVVLSRSDRTGGTRIAAPVPLLAVAQQAPVPPLPTGSTTALPSTPAPAAVEAGTTTTSSTSTTSTATATATATTTSMSSPVSAVTLATQARDAVRSLVAQAVSTAVATPSVPANLTPSLAKAHGNEAKPFRDGCFDGFKATALHSCTYGDPASSTTVVLFGDSHAAAWFPALEPLAVARGWRLEVFSKATCPPLDAAVWAPNFGREYRECDQWRDAVVEHVRTEHPSLVVLGANRAYGDAYRLPTFGPAWLDGLHTMVVALHEAGVPVVVLGPVPLPANDVPECLSAHLDEPAWCAPQARDDFVTRGIAAERATTEDAGGTYVDVRPFFCDPTGCVVIVGDLLVYRDQNHITTGFATWLSPALGAELDVVLAGQ